MSRAYDRNIERLKANQSAVSGQEQQQILQAGNASANRRISDANSVIRGLEKLSPTLQKMHDKRLERLEEEGREAARQARQDKLANLDENTRKLKGSLIVFMILVKNGFLKLIMNMHYYIEIWEIIPRHWKRLIYT